VHWQAHDPLAIGSCFILVLIYPKVCLSGWYRGSSPHCRSGLATLPSVGAIPYSARISVD